MIEPTLGFSWTFGLVGVFLSIFEAYYMYNAFVMMEGVLKRAFLYIGVSAMLLIGVIISFAAVATNYAPYEYASWRRGVHFLH